MLLSLLALGVAISALWLSRGLDEVIGLSIKLIGLFSLFLSLVYSPWLIKLVITAAVFVKSPLGLPQGGLSGGLNRGLGGTRSGERF